MAVKLTAIFLYNLFAAIVIYYANHGVILLFAPQNGTRYFLERISFVLVTIASGSMFSCCCSALHKETIESELALLDNSS